MRPILLIAGALILAAGLILLHLRRRKNGSSYQGGPRAANTELIRSLPEYKRIRAIYAVLSFLLEASLITACLSAMILAARPFRTEVLRGEEKKRDMQGVSLNDLFKAGSDDDEDGPVPVALKLTDEIERNLGLDEQNTYYIAFTNPIGLQNNNDRVKFIEYLFGKC